MHVRSGRALWAAALAPLFALPSPATPADDAAHRLAETFSGAHVDDAAGGRARREEAARKAAEAARRAFEAERAARQQRTDEADMLARARAEAAERDSAERRARDEATTREPAKAEAARAASSDRVVEAEDADRLGDVARDSPEAQKGAEDRQGDAPRFLAEAQRTEETRLLAERLRQVRDAEAERIVREAEADAAARRVESYDPPSTNPPGPAPVANSTATVLLVLEPGSRGIRRWNKTADPMLCVGETCYISTGAGSPATALTRAKAFGPGVALGSRAGACRNALGCVFRGIKLDHPATGMQPIDLRILRHDRREIREVTADETCRLARGSLSCRAPVRADTYRAWIVPEDLAELAGPEALAAAVATNLPEQVSGGE